VEEDEHKEESKDYSVKLSVWIWEHSIDIINFNYTKIIFTITFGEFEKSFNYRELRNFDEQTIVTPIQNFIKGKEYPLKVEVNYDNTSLITLLGNSTSIYGFAQKISTSIYGFAQKIEKNTFKFKIENNYIPDENNSVNELIIEAHKPNSILEEYGMRYTGNYFYTSLKFIIVDVEELY
jgi:hypothetical protein